ncbi:MAG: hypothetical protein ACUVUC_12685 [Thermoguttaceae bacterium]
MASPFAGQKIEQPIADLKAPGSSDYPCTDPADVDQVGGAMDRRDFLTGALVPLGGPAPGADPAAASAARPRRSVTLKEDLLVQETLSRACSAGPKYPGAPQR